jgi:hypothetical protein
MAGLAVELRGKTTHRGDPSPQVAAVTAKAPAPVCQGSRPVINDPVHGVLSARIQSRGAAVGAAALPRHPGKCEQRETDKGDIPYAHSSFSDTATDDLPGKTK